MPWRSSSAATASARTRLTGLGCDVLQGYGISRPLPEDELRAWIADREAVAVS